jgi:predicted nucleic acid-binding protein
MIPDKYTLWKTLHPDEWHCKYCRKALGVNICVDFLFADDGYDKDCRRFLEEGNYTTPVVEERIIAHLKRIENDTQDLSPERQVQTTNHAPKHMRH